jgi:polyhydroxyalkanoate synthesis regulator phasin
MVLDVIKKTLLAGLGATVVTTEKLESSIGELVKKGKLTSEEAKDLVSRIVEDSRKEYDDAREHMDAWFEEMIGKAGLVKKSRFDALEKRMQTLEKKMQGSE